MTAIPTRNSCAYWLGERLSTTWSCPSPDSIRASLSRFDIEDWVDREEDAETALGEPHHFHRVEVVARRVT